MIFTDFAKAFDTVPLPETVVQITMVWYQRPGPQLDLIISKLLSQCVILDGVSSSMQVSSFIWSTPEHSPWPYSFLIYINDLPEVILHSTIALFADDWILYKTISSYIYILLANVPVLSCRHTGKISCNSL